MKKYNIQVLGKEEREGDSRKKCKVQKPRDRAQGREQVRKTVAGEIHNTTTNTNCD